MATFSRSAHFSVPATFPRVAGEPPGATTPEEIAQRISVAIRAAVAITVEVTSKSEA